MRNRQGVKHARRFLAVSAQCVEERRFEPLVDTLQHTQMHLTVVLLQIEDAAKVAARSAHNVFDRSIRDHKDIKFRSQSLQHAAQVQTAFGAAERLHFRRIESQIV